MWDVPLLKGGVEIRTVNSGGIEVNGRESDDSTGLKIPDFFC